MIGPETGGQETEAGLLSLATQVVQIDLAVGVSEEHPLTVDTTLSEERGAADSHGPGKSGHLEVSA